MVNVAIVGYGRDGESIFHHLIYEGVQPTEITICDKGRDVDVPPGCHAQLGDDYLGDMARFDTVYRSAGVSPHQEWLDWLWEKIVSSAQMFVERHEGQMIAVTWTKGKSTTVSLLARVLKAAGKRVALIGNIGTPVLDTLTQLDQIDVVIYELSSYMLEWLMMKDQIAVLLNLFPEHHASWHGDCAAYWHAKKQILSSASYMSVGVAAMDEIDDAEREDIDMSVLATVGTWWDISWDGDGRYSDGRGVVQRSPDIRLQWDHNDAIIWHVIDLCRHLSIDYSYITEVLSSWGGLPHRMERLGVVDSISRVNDANASTPQSTILALETLWEDVETLLVWWMVSDQYDLWPLVGAIRDSWVKNLVCFSWTGDSIADALVDEWYMILRTRSMNDAVQFAKEYTQKGKTSLLSCGAPSYGLWKNFEEKGDLFKQCIGIK